jgi:hypothetical protein
MSNSVTELQLLAAMAYGESSYRFNDFEEMAGIASVLVRQRDARGYSSMQDFVKAEPNYSFVVKDGNPRYAIIMGQDEHNVEVALATAQSHHQTTLDKINALNSEIANEVDPKKIKIKHAELDKLKKIENGQSKQILDIQSHATAYKAAHNALEGGPDYSNEAFFWDGIDIKTNYRNHFKVKNGIKITSPEHNIFNLADSIKLVVIMHNVVKTNSAGKKVTIQTELGRYDHIYESTAARGGSIFWKQNPEYLRLTKAKEYK